MNRGIVMLLRAGDTYRLHFGELVLERDRGKHTARNCLVISEYHDTEARKSPYGGIEPGASQAPIAFHRCRVHGMMSMG